MNLWAKSLRQLCFAVALFFFSCEDENSFLGFPTDPGNQKFNVSFIEIALNSSTVLIDSVSTDNKTNAGVVSVGKYFDPAMGPLTATSYLQFIPLAAPVIPTSAFYDSVTVQFRLSFYSYGFTGEQTHKFTIHELTDSLDRYSRRYEFDDAIAYNPTPIGQISTTVRYDSLREQLGLESGQDTLLATATLNDAIGVRMFRLSQSYPFSGTNSQLVASQYRDFINTVKGIALVPSESNGVLGIRLDGFTKLTVHYHTVTNGVKDTLSRAYIVNAASFTNINNDRSASELGGLTYYQNIPTSMIGARYVQSGAPVVTRIDLDNFYQFADTVENVIVNEAELVLGGAQSTSGLEAHSSLGLKLMNPNNQFMNNKIDADSAAMARYHYVIEANTFHYFVQSDQPALNNPLRAGLIYDSDESRFAGYMTFFVQSLLREKNDADGINEQRVKHMAVYPNSPSIGYSVNRSIFDASQVKLRIFYTRPNLNANP